MIDLRVQNKEETEKERIFRFRCYSFRSIVDNIKTHTHVHDATIVPQVIGKRLVFITT